MEIFVSSKPYTWLWICKMNQQMHILSTIYYTALYYAAPKQMQSLGLTKYARPSNWHQNASASTSMATTDKAGTQEQQQSDIE